MTRRAFCSFHYRPDNWRSAQVRSMGVINGNKPASDNDWEDVKAGGGDAIQEWIDEQLAGKTVAIILIGWNAAGRKWINYEIKKAWGIRRECLGSTSIILRIATEINRKREAIHFQNSP